LSQLNSDNKLHLASTQASPVEKWSTIRAMNDQTTEQKSSATAMRADPGTNVQTFDTRDLFGSANEICIVHAGAFYRLKITRQGKLILNK